MDNKNEIVNLEGLSRRLKLSKRWLLAEAKAGRIPSLLAGNQRRFNPAAVEAALAKLAGADMQGGKA